MTSLELTHRGDLGPKALARESRWSFSRGGSLLPGEGER